jgi:D-alanyl-D-alanine carboxypeptidase/D-alanyl-D-alanine-endopeptidase (penicillin-binding protein 4)
MTRTRWRAVSGALAAAALVCAGLAVLDSGAASGGRSLPTLGTPLWSTRRVPTLLVDAVGSQRLQAALNGELAGEPTSCYVVAEGAEPIATHNPDTPLVPASTQKLLTTTAAVAILGPNFRYDTKAVATAAPVGGSIDHLWLVGSGDPVLSTDAFAAFLQADPTTHGDVTTSLSALANSIVAAGVKSIPGGVIGDDSRYDQQRYVPSWPASYRTDPEIGPLGALTVDDGYQVVNGTVTPVADPALYAAQTLTVLLAAHGVQVGPPSAHQMAPAGAAAIASVESPTLHDIAVSVLRSSDNLGAELFAKEIGYRTAGQGTTAAGVHGVLTTLATLGVPTAGVSLVDGSGLDHTNHVTCRALAAVLNLAATPRFQTILDGLPIAGEQGTLALRLQNTTLAGKLRAKTGSLDGVSALAGLLDAGRPLRFALIANDPNIPNEAAADGIRELFAGVLASFPDAPAPDALVPAPAPTRG